MDVDIFLPDGTCGAGGAVRANVEDSEMARITATLTFQDPIPDTCGIEFEEEEVFLDLRGWGGIDSVPLDVVRQLRGGTQSARTSTDLPFSRNVTR